MIKIVRQLERTLSCCDVFGGPCNKMFAEFSNKKLTQDLQVSQGFLSFPTGCRTGPTQPIGSEWKCFQSFSASFDEV